MKKGGRASKLAAPEVPRVCVSVTLAVPHRLRWYGIYEDPKHPSCDRSIVIAFDGTKGCRLSHTLVGCIPSCPAGSEGRSKATTCPEPVTRASSIAASGGMCSTTLLASDRPSLKRFRA